MSLLLGVDIGTSSLKLGVIEADSGDFLAWSDSKYQLLHPSVGLAELPADVYFDAFVEALKKLYDKVDIKQIKALSVSSQAQTFVCLDRDGQPLCNAISWLDTRANAQARELNGHFDSREIFNRTGLDSISAGMFAAMIKYIHDNESEIFARTWKFAQIASYLIYRLTGRVVWDENIAGMSGVYDWINHEYWGEMLDAIGVSEDKLPDVLPSGCVVGSLKSDIGEIGFADDVLVVTGANDQTANAIGVGLIDDTKTLIVLGTALIGFRVNIAGGLPKYDKDNSGRDVFRGICSVYPVPGMSYQLGYTNSGCGSFDWAKSLLAENMDYDAIFKQLEKVSIGSDGIVSLIDFDGRSWPLNVHYRGGFAGISRRSDRWAMLRAVVEGICFTVRELIELMAWDLTSKTVRVAGGAVRSELWLGILANILSVPLECVAYEQSGIVGSAIMAGVASGTFENYSEAIESVVSCSRRIFPTENESVEYARVYEKFKRFRNSMNEFYISSG